MKNLLIYIFAGALLLGCSSMQANYNVESKEIENIHQWLKKNPNWYL